MYVVYFVMICFSLKRKTTTMIKRESVAMDLKSMLNTEAEKGTFTWPGMTKYFRFLNFNK